MPYFSHGETKNKLIILYILARAGSLLTREQLYRTAILNSEMEYFAFEQAVSELEEDGMLAEVRRAFGECLGLTDAGREALALFEKSVPADERKKLDSYLDENRGAFARETEVSSRVETGANGCTLHLFITEHDRVIFSVSLAVASEEQALALRRRLESGSEAIFNFVWDTLLKNQEQR